MQRKRTLWKKQANPDGDTWNNEFEFYLGLDPNLSDEPEIFVQEDGANYIDSYSKKKRM